MKQQLHERIRAYFETKKRNPNWHWTGEAAEFMDIFSGIRKAFYAQQITWNDYEELMKELVPD